MPVNLTLSLPPAGLRRNHPAHWSQEKKLKDAYSVDVWQRARVQVAENAIPLRGSIRVLLEWRQTGKGDCDNCLSGAKVIFDCLGMAPKTMAGQDRYYMGFYESDGQIAEITIRREQVKSKLDECVEITLTEIA